MLNVFFSILFLIAICADKKIHILQQTASFFNRYNPRKIFSQRTIQQLNTIFTTFGSLPFSTSKVRTYKDAIVRSTLLPLLYSGYFVEYVFWFETFKSLYYVTYSLSHRSRLIRTLVDLFHILIHIEIYCM